MKKIFFIIFLILLGLLIIIDPIYSDELDPKTTFIIYFNNIYGEFSQYECSYAASNLNIFLQSKYKIKLIDNGLSTNLNSIEVLRKFNLHAYAELSGKIISVNYSNSKYKVGISVNLIFDSIKTKEIDLEKTKTFEGEESLSLTDSKAFTLSNSYIEFFSENIEKIIEILGK